MVGLLLLIAAAGKSALIPFSGWLPRAMEGPTPSSAVFYGALVRSPGRLPVAPGQPAPRLRRVLSRGGRDLGTGDGPVRLFGRQRADGHQVGLVVRLALAGRASSSPRSARVPLRRPDPHHWPRLPANPAVRAGSDLAAGLPDARERDRRPLAERPACSGGCREPVPSTTGSTDSPSIGESSTRSYPLTWSPRSCTHSGGAMHSSAAGPTFSPGRASRESDQVKPHFGTIEEQS